MATISTPSAKASRTGNRTNFENPSPNRRGSSRTRTAPTPRGTHALGSVSPLTRATPSAPPATATRDRSPDRLVITFHLCRPAGRSPNAGRTEAAVATGRRGQLVHPDGLYRWDRDDHKLGDPVAAQDLHRL